MLCSSKKFTIQTYKSYCNKKPIWFPHCDGMPNVPESLFILEFQPLLCILQNPLKFDIESWFANNS